MSLPVDLERYDWRAVHAALDDAGFARLPALLAPRECAGLAALFDDDARFRSTIDMARHGFGRGTYRYFADPLPPAVAALRAALYARLAPVARAWAVRSRDAAAAEHFPADLAAFLARCHAAGQARPTPLLLRYGAGDWNALHQDNYGEVAFPLQVVVALSERDAYDGGEFVLVEQRPRRQSRAAVLDIARGEGVVFTNRERPVRGARGDYRVNVRHGVSALRRGTRVTLGVIFHDAR